MYRLLFWTSVVAAEGLFCTSVFRTQGLDELLVVASTCCIINAVFCFIGGATRG